MKPKIFGLILIFFVSGCSNMPPVRLCGDIGALWGAVDVELCGDVGDGEFNPEVTVDAVD